MIEPIGRGESDRPRPYYHTAILNRVAPIATAFLLILPPVVRAAPTVIVVVGAEGTPEYGQQFMAWAGRWQTAARRAEASFAVIGQNTAAQKSDHDQLLARLETEPKEGIDELWLVLIGHGTYDDRTVRFNLRGPDVEETELVRVLASFRRPVIVVNCFACSGALLRRLSGPGRVVITATRSGREREFSRFGDYFSQAIMDPTADYDKDGQTSLLEAYLAASRRVAEFYRSDSRLATEHALLDDNGDALGTPADWFRGIQAVKKASDGASHDGYRAHQFVLVRSDLDRRITPELLARRGELEISVAELREKKNSLPEDEYFTQLEKILLELARIQEQVDQLPRP